MLVIPSRYNSTAGPLSPTAESSVWLCCSGFSSMQRTNSELVFVLTFVSQNKSLLINNGGSAFGPLPVRSFTLTRFDLPSLFHQWGQEVTEVLLHTTSPFGPATLKLSNSMEPDEGHSLSCTYLICSICIPSTDMIFGKLRSRRGVLTRAV